MLERYATNATVAMTRAIHGYMLDESNYRELLTKDSVSEVAEYLKKTKRYRSTMSAVDTTNIHRGFLEELLHRSNFDLYERLCRFQQLDKVDFYRFEIVANEIEQILSCIMNINSKSNEDFLVSLPGYLISRAGFDMIALAKSKSMQDLLLVLKNTSYYRILSDIKPDENGTIDYFRCELRLRTYYYKSLIEAVDKHFDKKTRAKLRSLILDEIDLINIINSYRMKRFFKASPAEVKSTILPFFGRLGKNKMMKLLEYESAEDMLLAFLKTSYGRQITAAVNPDYIEDSVNRVRYRLKKRALATAECAPVAVYAFMSVCEIEAENITNIIEGIRYGADRSEIYKLLIY